jgi:hypothetical protein
VLFANILPMCLFNNGIARSIVMWWVLRLKYETETGHLPKLLPASYNWTCTPLGRQGHMC